MANFDKEKMTIVDYLIKVEKYVVYKKKPKENNNIYLYKIDNPKFQIIKITDSFFDKAENFVFDDSVILQLKQFLNKKYPRAKLNILVVAFFENNPQVLTKDNNTLLIVDNYNYETKFVNYFPDFQKVIEDQKFENISSLSQEEIIQGMNDVNSPLSKKIIQLKEKTRLSTLVGSWFFLAPILAFLVLSLVVTFNPNSILNSLDINTLSLVFGGLTKDLLIWSLQIWRLWTFPFYSTFINLLICFFLLFISLGYLELSMKWWRLLLTYLILTPILGLFLTAVFPHSVISGPWIIIAVIYGAMLSNNYHHTDLLTYNSRIRSQILLIYLIFYPLFSFTSTISLIFLYLDIIIAVVGSYAFTFILKWNKNSNIVDLLVPSAGILIIFITSVIIFNINPYVPPLNNSVILMYNVYVSWNFSSQDWLNHMITNYYFLNLNSDMLPIIFQYTDKAAAAYNTIATVSQIRLW